MTRIQSETIRQIIGKGGETDVDLDEYFATLAPVGTQEMLGKWEGGYLFTRKRSWKLFFKNFMGFKWHGKAFLGPDNVQAQVWSFMNKVRFGIPGGSACLRQVEFRKKVSAAMIYSYLPISDYFRKIDDNLVMGIMEIRGRVRIYFYLQREPA